MTSGKSEVDMSTPVHPVATPLILWLRLTFLVTLQNVVKISYAVKNNVTTFQLNTAADRHVQLILLSHAGGSWSVGLCTRLCLWLCLSVCLRCKRKTDELSTPNSVDSHVDIRHPHCLACIDHEVKSSKVKARVTGLWSVLLAWVCMSIWLLMFLYCVQKTIQTFLAVTWINVIQVS